MIPSYDFSLLLYNCTGARTKLGNIRSGMQMLGLKIAILTETWLKQGVHPPKECIAASTTNAAGKKRGYGGTCFFIPDKDVRERARTVGIDEKNGRFSVIQIDSTVLAAIYLSPLTTVEECAETVTQVIYLIQQTKCPSVIIGGDFNMRHDSIGSAFSCKRGEELLPLLTSVGLQCINDGNPTHVREGWTSSLLDLFFTRNVNSEQASPAKDLYLGKSSHIPVILKTKMRIQNTIKTTRQRINLENMKVKEKRDQFERTMKEKSKYLEEEIANISAAIKSGDDNDSQGEINIRIDNLDKEFCKALCETAKETFGIIKARTFEPRSHENDTTKELFVKMQNAHRNANQEATETINQSLTNERKAVAKAQFREYCMEICQLPRSEQISRISKISRKMNIGSHGGLSEDQQTIEAAAEHFSKVFNSISPERHSGFAWRKDESEAWNLGNAIFSFENVLSSIVSLPRNKAGGNSGVINELLLCCEPVTLANTLSKFFNLCFSTGTIPSSWKKAVIVPVPKKGDLSMLENYRPISLLESLRKCYEKCLLTYLQVQMNAGKIKKLSDEQGGFRAGRSTLDQCAILQEMSVAAKKKLKCKLKVAFLDIKAAYDSVNRRILLEKCSQAGMENQVVESLRQLFDFNSGAVRIGGKISNSFKMRAGVQQGSLLSPLLYSVFLDGIRDALQSGPGFKFRILPKGTKEMMASPKKLNALLYADDIAVFARNVEELQKLLDLAQEFAKGNSFCFNAAKCVWIGESHEQEVFIGGVTIRRVESFEYLGITFGKKGIDSGKHIARLCGNARKIFFVLKRIGMNATGFSTNANILFYKTIIRPRLEYGLQVLKLSKGNKGKLEAAQHEFVCGAFSVGRNTSRTSLRVLGKIETMEVRLNILAERFRIRVIRLSACGRSFLGLIIFLLEKAWNLETYLSLEGSRSEFTLLSGVSMQEIESNNLNRTKYILEANLKDLEAIKRKQNSDSPVWNLDITIVRKNLCTNRLDIGTRRSLVLYLLKKDPHQGNCCLKDKTPLTAMHLVQCNLGNWQACSLRIQGVFKGPKNSQKKVKFAEVPIDGYYIPKLISLGMEEQCNARAKKILLIVGNSVKTSVRKCLSGTYSSHSLRL
jgi:hypothetical protein